MISAGKQEEMRLRLRRAETEHDVRVLLAVESGSRAWGFASPDSDYDGRFIYVNRPDWYLSVGLEEQRDVIEYPIVDDMDINGWDLRKALRLFQRSNPGFVEWVQSPLVYDPLAVSPPGRAPCCRACIRSNAAYTTTAAWRKPIFAAICKLSASP